MAEIQVRKLGPGDVEAVMPLLIQLGYELNVEDLRTRFDALAAATGHVIFGAVRDGALAGFCHVYVRPALEKPSEAIVQALVVDTQERKAGIGRVLMDAVEAWAREGGYASVVLYSQEDRKDAHAFYEGLGYEGMATSVLLRKWLEQSAE